MTVENTDWLLVQRVQQGDSRGFDLLVLKYQSKLATVVSRYIKDHDDIKDVVQEAFIRAYRAIDNFRGDSAFYTWLYRIGINTAKNHLFSRARKPPARDIDASDAEFFDNAPLLKEQLTPETHLANKQLEKGIYKSIAQLPEELKMALTLREFDGLSYEEIAQAMDTPIGTVRSRIFRARAQIEKTINQLAMQTA